MTLPPKYLSMHFLRMTLFFYQYHYQKTRISITYKILLFTIYSLGIGDMTQLIEYMPSMHKAMGSV